MTGGLPAEMPALAIEPCPRRDGFGGLVELRYVFRLGLRDTQRQRMCREEDGCAIAFAFWQSGEPFVNPLRDRFDELVVFIPGGCEPEFGHGGLQNPHGFTKGLLVATHQHFGVLRAHDDADDRVAAFVGE